MTPIQALLLVTFENHCTCGGFSGMTGRPNEQPHLSNCAQAAEWQVWSQALSRAEWIDLVAVYREKTVQLLRSLTGDGATDQSALSAFRFQIEEIDRRFREHRKP